jgi:hypothetical protein
MAVPSPDAGRASRPRPSRPLAAAELVVAGGLAAFATAAVVSPAAAGSGPVVCPFRRLTGLPCPACGLTRSWVDLAHGDLVGSVQQNPFGPVLLAGLVALVVLVVRARRDGAPAPRMEALARTPLVLAVAVLWGAFGLVRMTA